MADENEAVTPPRNRAVEFTIRGKWAHFGRIDTTTVKQSYRIIPPTTAMGLVAALLGYSRDSYYDAFSKQNAAFSIIVDSPIDPFQLAKLDLSTAGEDFESGRGKGVLRNFISRESTLGDRQQRLYEYLRDPSYRIFVSLNDDEVHNDLVDRLAAKKFAYTPCLGRSECVAHVPEWDVHELEPTTVESVDSTAPIDTAKATSSVSVERTPQRLTTAKHSRKPTSFVSYAFSKAGEQVSVLPSTEAYTTGDDALLFV